MLANRTIRDVLIAITAAILLLSFSAYYLAHPSEVEDPGVAIAPEVLCRMNKMVVSSGTEALQLVKQSHTGSIEYVKDVAIMHYIKEHGMLTLWTTQYPNETIANNETEKMVLGMRNWGGSWASNLKEITVAGKQVYQTTPDGESYHYFWVDGNWVFYIIPHNLSQDEVAECIAAIP